MVDIGVLVVVWVSAGLAHVMVLRHLDRKIAAQDRRLAEACQKMADVLTSDAQSLTVGDLKELNRQLQLEEQRFDTGLANAVGVLGVGAVKVGPLKACWTQDHGDC